jgi:hypothetical protein
MEIIIIVLILVVIAVIAYTIKKIIKIGWLKKNWPRTVGAAIALILGLIGAYYIFISITPSQIQTGGNAIKMDNWLIGSAKQNNSSANFQNLAQIDPLEAQRGIYFEIAALIFQFISTFL